MAKQHTNSKSGFTIIEVVLVLAIAGLIFLMVFVALPALQRSQRDTQRTDDMARVQSQLMSWQNNHNNRLPEASTCIVDSNGEYSTSSSDACKFIDEYMNSAAQSNSEGNTFVDPSGDYYSLVVTCNYSGGQINKASGSETCKDSIEVETASGKFSSNLDTSNVNKSISLDKDAQFDSHVMWLIPGSTCDGENAVPSAKNNFAILYRLEGSGIKCTNNGS